MSDMFKVFNGEEVDLDDLSTYHDRRFFRSIMGLYEWAWEELGKSLFYMQFFHPEIDWDAQEEKVHEYCRVFASECREHFHDTEENKMWFRKLIFKFLDEVENQC